LIFAAAEAVALHVDPAPEERGLRVEVAQGGAVGLREQWREEGVSAKGEVRFEGGPVESVEA
jgi:hypothetical protein